MSVYRGWNELLGIFVGHVYFFLMFKYPQDFGGTQFISTPQILWEKHTYIISTTLAKQKFSGVMLKIH